MSDETRSLPPTNTSLREQQLERVLADYLRRIEQGEIVDRAALLAQHPELADELQEFLSNNALFRRGGPPTIAPRSPPPRLRYFGDYQLLEQIGSGGMGVIYRARQTSLQRNVAVKMILEGRLPSSEDRQRFRVEAEAAASLDHPGILPIYEVGEYEGRQYFSMKLVEGGSLSQRTARGPLPSRDAARLMIAVARAVHFAHERGILHRDLKPANILVDNEQQPFVTDFGLAKRIHGDSALTMTGAVLGTPSYMAPEQASGKGRNITTLTDVYGLGAILYAMLTGKAPFHSEDVVETLRQVLDQEPKRPSLHNPKVDRDLETICLKCLEKEPARRYSAAAALALDLEHYLAGEPVSARPISASARAWRWCRRNPWVTSLSTLAGLLLLVVAIGGPVAAVMLREQRDQAVKNFERADQAEQDTKDKLYESYLAQARAGRFSGRLGQRFESLKVIATAAKMRPSLELRNEAIACLALPDVRFQRTLEADFADPYWVAIDPQFLRYAYADAGKNVIVRNVADGKTVARITPPEPSQWMNVRFSPDGSYLALSYLCGRNVVRVYDLAGATPRLALTLDPCGDYAFSSQGKQLTAGNSAGEIASYDLRTGEMVRVIAKLIPLRRLAMSPQGDRIAVVGESESLVQILDAASGQKVWSFELPAPIAPTSGLAWRPDGKLLAVGCNDRRIHVWDMVLFRPQASLDGHEGMEVAPVFDAAGDFLISRSWDWTVRFWDAVTGKQRLSMRGQFVAISADSKQVAVVGRTSGLKLWDFANGAEFQVLHHGNLGNQTPHPGKIGPSSIDFDTTGRLLASTDFDGVRIWDCAHPQSDVGYLESQDLRQARFRPTGTGLTVHGYHGLIELPMQNSPSSPSTITFGAPASVSETKSHQFCRIAWDGTGRRLAATDVHPGRTFVLKITPDATPLLDAPTPSQTNQISLHRDGAWLAMGTWNPPDVVVWNVETGYAATERQGAHRPTFSPSGKWLGVARQREFHLIPTAAWDATRVIPVEEEAWVNAFAPDDGLWALVSGTQLQLVNIETGEQVAVLDAPVASTPEELMFNRDGSCLAVAGGSHTIQLWDLRLIRSQLKALGLDWDLPALPTSAWSRDSPPMTINFAPSTTVTESVAWTTSRWVIDLGGYVEPRIGGPRFHEVEALPKVPFDIAVVDLERTMVKDADLKRLAPLSKLALLWMRDTSITDEGVAHLAACQHVVWLCLDDTKITAAALPHLKGLHELRQLQLVNTHIDDASLEHLTGLTQLLALSLNETPITDAGLVHLYGLTRLRYLDVSQTAVSQAGIEELKSRLPNLKVDSQHPSGRRWQEWMDPNFDSRTP